MIFAKDLYLGKSIRKPEKLKWKLRHGAGTFNVQVITLAENSDQLEIYPGAVMKQKYFPVSSLYVVGLAGNYGEALELVTQMITEALQATGKADAKAFLLQKRNKNP